MTVCELNKCTGCMACIDICPKGAITIKDTLSAYNAEIDAGKCVNCNLCHHICQNNNIIKLNTPIEWYQGWASDESVRAIGASGGAASSIMRTFIANGGYVCSCVFVNGQFVFKVTNDKEDLIKFAGSKYVKSNPEGVYKQIKALLQQGNKVLFIGLPCQVSALILYIGKSLSDNLFTIDLICHGTPSPMLLDNFLGQYKLSTIDIKDIKFRVKNKFQVRDGFKGVETTGITDSYLISFLNGLCYTQNCYLCQYAKLDRVSDITLGDSWGTELSSSEANKGISLILCQTHKGIDLINNSNLVLHNVELEKAILANKQLQSPSDIPKSRDQFFKGISEGIKYNKIICKLYPKQSLKQTIKKFLIKFRLYNN